MPDFAFDSPQAALLALTTRTERVGVETLPLARVQGRVLAESVNADRPSPPCDVSAMDGYAVRLADLASGSLPIKDHVRIGREPPPMPAAAALHIVTGAPVPPGADAVIRREDVREFTDRIELAIDPGSVPQGGNIRRAGENLAAGADVLCPGQVITPPVAGALAAFGRAEPLVYKPVRVAVLITGDELRNPDDAPTPWCLRDSNGPALTTLLESVPWIECSRPVRVADEMHTLRDAAASAIDQADAVILTGGVSMGDRDFVPAVLADLGCEIVFHKLPQRPGKPALGAIAPGGKPVLGLPGNPLSVLVTARRLAMPTLAAQAGIASLPPPPAIAMTETDDKTLGLWWFRLVRFTQDGQAQLTTSRGSGDIPSAARADGFVEIPPNTTTTGYLPFYTWSF